MCKQEVTQAGNHILVALNYLKELAEQTPSDRDLSELINEDFHIVNTD